MSEEIKPRDHGEAVALFRAQVIGPLVARILSRGELADGVRMLSKVAMSAPGSASTRSFSPTTIERWYYAFKSNGLDALRPQSRKAGFALDLNDEQRALILKIAAERPEVSATVLLRTLVADGRMQRHQVSAATLRRLLARHGLDRATQRRVARGRVRRRWQAEAPGVLWHADVCHGPSLKIEGRTVPLRVHAILDDASRYIIGIRAFSSERETDMLALLVQSLRLHGRPRTLYLDNGATYRGDALRTACGRLGVALIHAEPYDPEARGKMERFWRTLREGCLDHVAACATLHDVQVRLLAFLDEHYLAEPHAGLLGRCPAHAFAENRSTNETTEEDLREALTVRTTRKVRRDGTVGVGGVEWEVEDGFLAGKKVMIARTLADPDLPPWVEEGERRHALVALDPVANGLRRRLASKRAMRSVDAIPFDPASALLRRAMKGGAR